MTLETLDWVTEAERIRLAFDVKGECEFAESEDGWNFVGTDKESKRLRQNNLTRVELNGHNDLFLYCIYYDETGRYFEICHEVEDELPCAISITIEWDGNVSPMIRNQMFEDVDILAKGLFHLDLLTCDVAEELDLSISAHQKLEWSLEHEWRTGQG